MIVIFYFSAIFLLGLLVKQRLFHEEFDIVSNVIFSSIFGLLISVPLTYVFSVLASNYYDPILVGIIIFTITIGVLAYFSKVNMSMLKLKKCDVVDLLVLLFCVCFSVYIMGKSFKVNNEGLIQVQRNTVFDFGHSLSVIRSMSWVNNIPYTSPFVAQTQHIYHFMFQFWVAVLEHLGLPISVAMNFPSVIGFSLLLWIMYFFGKKLFKNNIIGILGIVFLIFHGGLMFVPYFLKNGVSLHNFFQTSNYLFFGPFDGSTYSLFFTLNVFVNQRHLGFALAVFFLLYYFFYQAIQQKKTTVLLIFYFSLFIGFFVLWHMVLAIGLTLVFLLVLLLNKKWKEFFVLLINTLFITLFVVFPWIPSLILALISLLSDQNIVDSTGPKIGGSVLVWFVKFIVLNFGLSLIFFSISLLKGKKSVRFFYPLLVFISFLNMLAIPFGIIDQKFVNVFLVISALFIADGLIIFWQKGRLSKIAVFVIFPFLILSGIIDFMVIKNDYLFPIEQTENGKLISWIRDNTKPNAIFISYQDIFDPVTLSGRRNYFGFFKQSNKLLEPKDRQREEIVKKIFEASEQQALKEGVELTQAEYIMFPTKEKTDFKYLINKKLFDRTFNLILSDYDHQIFRVANDQD